MSDASGKGLTSAEVAERVRQGQVNRTPRAEWRDYATILARNTLTWFNAMVTPAAIGLILLHQYQGAIAVSGMAIVNSLIGLVQEIRSKWHLDRLAILVEAKARVLRDGQVAAIPAGAVVLDDHVLLAAGESVVADGPVLEAHFLEVDEALLTGESDPVRRHPGDLLLSGSFCVAGEGMYRAAKVGAGAFANETSAQARRYAYIASPLTHVINRLIQILSYTALALCGLCLVVYVLDTSTSLVEREKEFVGGAAATITSMVPQGLVLTATLAFTLGAVHMSLRGAVVQHLSAVESMAAVDVICTDKTGTLTTNHLRLERLEVLGSAFSEDEVRRLLRLFASASVDHTNRSIMALRAGLGATQVELLDQLPFKAQNRYSAVRIRDGGDERTLVLGACEALEPYVEDGRDALEARLQALLTTGLRMLLFAESPCHAPFAGTLDGFPLQPLALIGLGDELRPEAGRVLEALAAQGIAFKILSGDNPETVRVTVSHLSLPLAHEPVVAGAEVDAASDRAEIIRACGVFGRVAPRQKLQIVETLQQQGRHVAMIGDGVNDVLPLKRADLGWRKAGPSSATCAAPPSCS
jgi:cation-transporting ATPase E